MTSARARSTPDLETARVLLRWYDRHARAMPWRARPGERPDPYRVWLSEVMLQQTTVATVGPYFSRFLARWPDVWALAAAPREEVLAAWAGLGYYARARNLHACAQAVVRDHGGAFPATEAGLRGLPGIGPYTAGAIAAIAFGQPALAIDGNVERVVTRLAAITTALPAAKAEIRRILERCLPVDRPGDFAQALMDLGATICVPRAPRCGTCPWHDACRALSRGTVERFPVKPPRRPRPLRRGTAFVLLNPAGEVWVTRRPDDGLLGGMRGVPTTAWTPEGPDAAAARAARPGDRRWRLCREPVRHGFTHFELVLDVAVATARIAPRTEGAWRTVKSLNQAGFPTLFRRVIEVALAALETGAFTRP
ncbi:MAG: A/G-specific adenine glycosylase [Alphaproteobacteria bacterium]|nr:A/G-specific adenine glycosylase [Alphaproteobacteria bacterium]